VTQPLPPFTRIERAALVVGVAMVLAMTWSIRGYLTDDTFIHLQYARHLAGGHGLVFNLGERVYGCTSPLWVALLADGIGLGLDGLWVGKLIGVFAAVASVGLFLQLLRRTVATPGVRAAATVAWASNAWMARWATSGMETPLAVALVLAGFVAFTEGKTWGAHPVRTGSLWALAALTRPEVILLLFLWCACLLIETEDRFGLRRMIAGALPPLVIVGGWLLFARIYFGTFWPHTLVAKAAGSSSMAFHVDSAWRQIRLVGATDGLLVVVLLVALLLGGVRLARPVRAHRWLPWVWLGGLPALYFARGVPVLSRYALVLLPVMAWLAWRAAERWWLGRGDAPPTPARSRRAAVFATVLAGLVVIQNLLVFQATVIPHVRSSSPALEQSLIRWGRWFGKNTPEHTVIATPDIGAIGYYSGRPVVDLAGLVTPAMVPALVRESPEEAVASFAFASFSRPEYLVDRGPSPYSLTGGSRFGGALVPLGFASMPRLGLASMGPTTYSFYRIDWAAFDSLRAAAAH
jgi:hypothetical protein